MSAEFILFVAQFEKESDKIVFLEKPLKNTLFLKHLP